MQIPSEVRYRVACLRHKQRRQPLHIPPPQGVMLDHDHLQQVWVECVSTHAHTPVTPLPFRHGMSQPPSLHPPLNAMSSSLSASLCCSANGEKGPPSQQHTKASFNASLDDESLMQHPTTTTTTPYPLPACQRPTHQGQTFWVHSCSCHTCADLKGKRNDCNLELLQYILGSALLLYCCAIITCAPSDLANLSIRSSLNTSRPHVPGKGFT